MTRSHKQQPVKTFMEPSELAARLERDVQPLPGPTDRFRGYGVMGLTFADGDVLALRRFPSTSDQMSYTSVWHRTRDGRWTLYTDISGVRGCARYFRPAMAEAVVVPIRVEWPTARRLAVSIDGGRQLVWSICLVASIRSQLFATAAPALPAWCWRQRATRRPLEALIGATFRTGRLSLAGSTPSGHHYLVQPQGLWPIDTSRARLCGRDLGNPAPLPQQAALGIFWIPQRGLFMTGEIEMCAPPPT